MIRTVQIKIMKKKNLLYRAVLLLIVLSSVSTSAQNINTPNKPGRWGCSKHTYRQPVLPAQ